MSAALTERAEQVGAPCTRRDPALWFPRRGASSAPAKQMCAECPLQAECLAEALNDPTTYGIWGGTDHEERRALRAKNPRPRRTA